MGAKRKQQVVRLDVAVHQTALMSMLKAESRLADAVAGLCDGQRSMLLDEPCQVGALDILHCQEVRRANVAGIVSEHDVGMDQLGRRLNFLEESLRRLGTIQFFLVDDLEG